MELKEKGSVGDPSFESGGGGVLGVSVLVEEADCNVVSARFGPSWPGRFFFRLGSAQFLFFIFNSPCTFRLACKIMLQN